MTRATLASALRRVAPAITLAAAVILFRLIAPNAPFSIDHARLILVHTVVVGLVGVGMTLVIVSGGIDLSVGSLAALACVVAARVTEHEQPGALGAMQPWLAILAGAAVGAACGAWNGLLIVALRLPPFIVTLGMFGFYRGLAKWAADSSQVIGHPAWLYDWVLAKPQGSLARFIVAPSAWLFLLAAVGMAALIHWTVIGRRAVAIGSNEEAARRAAVPIGRVKIAVYALSGTLVGLAGVAQFAILGGSGDPTTAPGLELNAIAAVVIGGASLSGGTASVAGTLCGALLMGLLDDRAIALDWPNYVQELVVGNIIILAVAFDRWRAARMGG